MKIDLSLILVSFVIILNILKESYTVVTDRIIREKCFRMNFNTKTKIQRFRKFSQNKQIQKTHLIQRPTFRVMTNPHFAASIIQYKHILTYLMK